MIWNGFAAVVMAALIGLFLWAALVVAFWHPALLVFFALPIGVGAGWAVIGYYIREDDE